MAVEMEKSSLDNSYETKLKIESKEKVSPIVSKNALAKESVGSKFKKSFFSDDMKDVGSYILFDLIVPGIKDGVLSAIERMFYGGSSDRYSRRDRRDDRDRVSYSSYYKSSRDRDRRDDEKDEPVDYRHIVLRYEDDAKKIVRKMRDYIREYDSVSVARLLDLIDQPGKYTDNNYGWTHEEDIGIRHVRNGYLIDVPEAVYLGD